MLDTLARRQVGLVAAVQVLGLAGWFSATAIAPTLRAEWDLTQSSAVWLTASVQLGFATGAVVSGLLTLADRVRPEEFSLFIVSTLIVTGASLAFLLARTFAPLRDIRAALRQSPSDHA